MPGGIINERIKLFKMWSFLVSKKTTEAKNLPKMYIPVLGYPAEDKNMNNKERPDMACIWIIDDQCTRAHIWRDIRDHNPVLPPHERLELFSRTACKYCLEGKKVNALRCKR